MRETSLTLRTLNGIKWACVTDAAQALISLLILVVLSRLLMPADFGLFAIALIFVVLTDTVGKLSIGPAIVQRLDLTDRHIEIGFTLSVGAGVVLTALLWLLAPGIGRFFAEPLVPPILETLSVIFIITGLGVVSEHLLQRNLRFKRLMVANILSQSVGYGLVTIVMALLEFGVWALVWGIIARHAIFTLVVIAYRPPPLGLGLARREAADLLRFGAGFSLISLFNVLAHQGVSFIIGRWLGATPLGYYTRATRLVSPPARLGLVLLKVLFPAMAERQQRTDRLGVAYLHGIEMLSLLALPTSIMMALSAPEIVAVVLGGQWDGAVSILRILAVGSAFHACNTLSVPSIRALGAVYREAWRRALYALLVALGAWLGIRWGVAGVAAAIVCARIVLHLLLTQLTLSLLGLRWRRLLRCHLPALWAGVWVAAALWLATGLVREASLPAVAALLVELAAWSAAVVAATYYAPPFARPLFARWGLAQVPFDDLGRAGRCLRFALERLERHAPRQAS